MYRFKLRVHARRAAAPPLPCMRRMRPCMRGGCRGGRQVVGYDAAGRVLNYSGVATPTPAEIAADAQKVGALPRCSGRQTVGLHAP